MVYRESGADKNQQPSPPLDRAPFAEAMAYYQAARLAEAEQLCRKILTVYPRNADSYHLLGLIARRSGNKDAGADFIRKAIALDGTIAPYHFNFGVALMDQRKHDEAVASYRKAIELKPDYVRAYLNLGNALRKLGRQEEAAQSYKDALALKPDYAEAHNNLGSVLWERGKPKDAIVSFRQALAIKSDFAEAHNNLGNALQDEQQFAEAADAYRSALKLRPDFAQAHNNLGNVLRKLGDDDAAIQSYRRALVLEPAYAIAHNNLGNTLRERGDIDGAIASYYRAVGLAPDFAEAHFNLAGALKGQCKFADAETSVRRGLSVKPDSIDALNALASILLMQHRLVPAFDAIRHSLQIKETEQAKRIFVSCAKHADWRSHVAELRALMVRALTDPWDRPSDLAQTCARFLKQDPAVGPSIARASNAWSQYLEGNVRFERNGLATIAANPLFDALLCTAPNADMEMERFLTIARRALLDAARFGMEAEPPLHFHSLLARQCFINEYVFRTTAEETQAAQDLGDLLSQSLETGRPVPELVVLAVASYLPLSSISLAARLLDRPWPEAVMMVLLQQVRQPDDERHLREEIPQLTDTEEETSRLVQRQYEESPYPRWIRAAPAERADSITGYLHQKFPLTVARSSEEKQQALRILIAGCGTGQHSIETAQCFPEANVLAIDLSASSLGYASYKTRELGIGTIEYAQADIMALGGMDRRFDMVESVGVLHHLRDAFAGWEILISLLAQGGFMRLGLYSKTARRNIAAARTFLAERGYGTGPDDIRNARQDIAEWDNRAGAEAILNSPDFFSLSSCRDLIFHAQEHCTTLAHIDAFIKRHGLMFLGFDLVGEVLDAYRRRFPNDPAAINLGQWGAFEDDNPGTFAGMYQFWIRKAS